MFRTIGTRDPTARSSLITSAAPSTWNSDRSLLFTLFNARTLVFATLLAYLKHNHLHRSLAVQSGLSTVTSVEPALVKGLSHLALPPWESAYNPFSYPLEIGGSQIQSWPGFCRGSPYRWVQIGLVVNKTGLHAHSLHQTEPLPMGSNRTCYKRMVGFHRPFLLFTIAGGRGIHHPTCSRCLHFSVRMPRPYNDSLS